MKQKGAEDVGKVLKKKKSYVGDDNPFGNYDESVHKKVNIIPKNTYLVERETPLMDCEVIKSTYWP